VTKLVVCTEKKEQRVKRLHILAFAAIAFTITELIVRAIVKDYTIGHFIFVAELLLVGVFMLYYTMKFS
jgi:hypothetical protein